MKNNYLRAQSCLVMENTFNKITEFLGSDLALTPDAYTAGVADHFAHHVLGRMSVSTLFKSFHVHFPPANWPFSNVIWPNVRGY